MTANFWRRCHHARIALCTLRVSRAYATTATREHDPLKILFCGADQFSIHSLRALHVLQQRRPDKVASIDVLCRTDKRVGRGLKRTQQVPIKPVASQMGLKLHQIDSLKEWQAPLDINLVIAVSFGLLVPGTLLQSAKYGGLNVHPSLLPQLRGPAPIQHALLQRLTETGVTLQTMHPTRFDHGVILSQHAVPVVDEERVDRMINSLGVVGSKLLVTGIEDAMFIPPYLDEGMIRSETPTYAPKLTPADRQIDWSSWTADEIVLRSEVLGDLWDDVTCDRCHGHLGGSGPVSKRIKFKGPWSVVDHAPSTVRSSPGYPHVHGGPTNARVGLITIDGRLVCPREIVIEGGKSDGHGRILQALRTRDTSNPAT